MNHIALDAIVAIHKDMKMLNWWDGEDPFQIIAETMGTQQCKLIEASIWTYDLKLLADESTGGNMLSVVENELDGWLNMENSSWPKEAESAQEKQDWDRSKIGYLKNDNNRRASVATRSLWAWYGKKFPMRIYPKFITTKEWTRKHKQWLLENSTDNILSKLNFNIIAAKRKLNGIRDFIKTELDGGLRNMGRNTVLRGKKGSALEL